MVPPTGHTQALTLAPHPVKHDHTLQILHEAVQRCLLLVTRTPSMQYIMAQTIRMTLFIGRPQG